MLGTVLEQKEHRLVLPPLLPGKTKLRVCPPLDQLESALTTENKAVTTTSHVTFPEMQSPAFRNRETPEVAVKRQQIP